MAREARSVRCPESVLGWIPWYGEEDEYGASLLTERQRGAVEAHSAQCADCRAEIEMIAGAPFEIDVDLPDPARVFEEITARIAAGESATESSTPVIPIDRGRTLEEEDYGKLAEWVLAGEEEAELTAGLFVGAEDEGAQALPDLLQTPTSSGSEGQVIEGPWRQGRAALVAAAAALAVFFAGGLAGSRFEARDAGTMMALTGDAGRSAIENGATAGAGEVTYDLASAGSVGHQGPSIEVVFDESIALSQVSETLRGMSVEIVSGPSSMGVYRLQAKAGADAISSAEAAAIAARLKSGERPIVIFAEAVP